MTSKDTRTHIIHTGADLIGHKGFGATGINAVLATAGVPKGSFYHHFSSKHDFGLAVIDTFAEEYDARLSRILNDTSRSCVDHASTVQSGNGALRTQTVLLMSRAHPSQEVDLWLSRSNSTPSLRLHYSGIKATTGRSVLNPCIGTLHLAFLHLMPSLNITVLSSHSSVEAPESSSRHLYAGHRPSSKQVSDGLIPGIVVAPGSDVSYQFRHLNDGSLVLAFSILT